MKDSDVFIETVICEKDVARLNSEQFTADLADGINWLIDHNFEKLIYLLYRVDVSEDKIRAALACSTQANTGVALSRLIIDRLITKIETRRAQAPPETDEDDSERW